ncbi:hypothetical protein WA845_04215 [Agrobacterium sp. CMT1]|uniref:hypothetical protein n=1 Tax=Agrobacterium sp. CMT1 TaxID=3128901 RepID=UPI0030787A88
MTHVTYSNETSPEELDAFKREYERINPRQDGKQVVGVYVNGGGTQIDTVDGKQVVQKKFEGSVAVKSALRPGHIMIGGTETTIDAALAAGLITREQAASGSFNLPVQPQAKVETGVADKAPEQSQKGPEELSEAAQAAKEASETLQELDATVGAAAVDAALENVIESGYLPEADELPEGADLGHVVKITAGYVAQANNVLADVHANVPLLMDFLSDDELRDARRATIGNAPDSLRDLGRIAVDRLAMLPQTNPERFAEHLEGMSPAERKALRRTPNGEWTVTVPGYPEMGFGAAVRAGIVRL